MKAAWLQDKDKKDESDEDLSFNYCSPTFLLSLLLLSSNNKRRNSSFYFPSCLLIHRIRDHVVPFTSSLKLRRMMLNCGIDCNLFFHDFLSDDHSDNNHHQQKPQSSSISSSMFQRSEKSKYNLIQSAFDNHSLPMFDLFSPISKSSIKISNWISSDKFDQKRKVDKKMVFIRSKL